MGVLGCIDPIDFSVASLGSQHIARLQAILWETSSLCEMHVYIRSWNHRPESEQNKFQLKSADHVVVQRSELNQVFY